MDRLIDPKRSAVHMMHRRAERKHLEKEPSIERSVPRERTQPTLCWNSTSLKDSYWGRFLRAICAVQSPTKPNRKQAIKRTKPFSLSTSDLRSYPQTSKKSFKEISLIVNSMDAIFNLPEDPIVTASLPFTGTPSYRRRCFIVSLFGWKRNLTNMRHILGQLLTQSEFHNEGRMLTTIEYNAIWTLGEYDSIYPVMHIIASSDTNKLRTLRSKAVEVSKNQFEVLVGTYEQYAHLNLPHLDLIPSGWHKFVLLLAYKSLESSTDQGLVRGWLRWSGAWLAYSLLVERKIPVSAIALYVRENTRPREAFKYMVLIEVLTEDFDQLLATTQRLRVERWSGYICLYASVSLEQFIRMHPNEATPDDQDCF